MHWRWNFCRVHLLQSTHATTDSLTISAHTSVHALERYSDGIHSSTPLLNKLTFGIIKWCHIRCY